ncbi:MAG: YueI family protein [Halanaerobiales bacterium]
MDEKKSKLEEKITEGVYGKKELKKSEKNRYLGEFKERVIRYLTMDQLLEKGVYPEIIEAVRHPEAKKLIIDRKADLSAANEYVKLASANNLTFKRVDSPDLKGDVALVVVSDHAVDVEKRKVLSRAERLKDKGISDKIIENPGAKLCKDCWNELKEKAPEELINYKKITAFDKITGIKCVCKEN